MLTKFDLFCLINVANFQSGLLRNNLILSANDFETFNKYKNGIPLLIPANRNILILRIEMYLKLSGKIGYKYLWDGRFYVGFSMHFRKLIQKFQVKNQFEDCLDNCKTKP